MSKKDLRIIYMGTPEFAVASLKELHTNGFSIVAVITAPDKPRGRGRQPASSAVKQAALDLGLPVLQPTNLKDEGFIEQLRSFEADLQIVVAFRMLPRVVWDMPPLGTFNLHASLLPAYRGAAPINWAIINGETETGVTTFFLKHEIDTGEIILQEKEPIHDDDTVGDLYERLMIRGARLVVKTTELISRGTVTTTPQPSNDNAPEAPKIFRETCELNFDQPARDVYNFIRGLSPYPAAWMNVGESIVKIFKCSTFEGTSSLSPGESASDQKTFWHIGTADGYIAVEELQWQGKRRMDIKSFLLGNSI
jgi:methionyl-tRNA formyltransferase